MINKEFEPPAVSLSPQAAVLRDRPPFDDLAALLPDWRRCLRASNKAPLTIDSYLAAGRGLLTFLHGAGMPTAVENINREHLESYMVGMQGRGLAPATVAKHYRSLEQLFRWLVDDGEIERSPFERMTPPAVPEQPVDVLTEQELGKLLAACSGQSFENRRDTALIRLLADTGARASEVMGLSLTDVDFEIDVAYVMGMGRRSRGLPMGPRTANALRRYMRLRMRHQFANTTDALWLGKRGPLWAQGSDKCSSAVGSTLGSSRSIPTDSVTRSPTNGWPREGRKPT